MPKKYDLHSHTNHSDGKLSVEDLLMRALEKGVNVLAITDHDTTTAIPEAKSYIESNQLPIQLISGVEISTKWESFEIHIVGLNFDESQSLLQQRLATQIERREARAQKIGERLAKSKIEGAYEAAKELAGDGAVTRAHFAQHIVNIGLAKTIPQVFKKYLTRGKIGYVPSEWISIAEAIQWIHDAGGQAILAHPGRYQLSAKWLRRLILVFKESGGDGLEVALSQQSPAERSQLIRYASEYGLLASVGSDFHYPTNWMDLGRNLYIPETCSPVWEHWPNHIPHHIEVAS
ncbi:RNase RNM [Algicola sagamiensis]|uniref:RNase RNM n=1 Tax=Algicola sagamiensis TaxID=163869 RepID=UPI00037D06DD|nr:PHP domain-containing protein [Algicola sagamiensis]